MFLKNAAMSDGHITITDQQNVHTHSMNRYLRRGEGGGGKEKGAGRSREEGRKREDGGGKEEGGRREGGGSREEQGGVMEDGLQV